LIRRGLNDAQWRRIERTIPGKKGDRGRSGTDNRLFVHAVLWVLRTGSPWRDLPEEFGNWNSVFQRFRRWAKKGVWESLFKALVEDPDFEYLMIDATVIRAHQHAAGAKGAASMRRSGVRAAV
jgi:putative transposase